MIDKILLTTFNEYRILKAIGEGGNGVVYEAIDENNIKCAIKVLTKEKASSVKRKRFENEVKFCSANNHKNIIKYLDNGLSADGSPFVVMPIYEGSLRKFIPQLNDNEKIGIIVNILSGIEYAHLMQTIHRDIKPENILITTKKEAVVADFGIAHFHEDDMATIVETRPGERLANFQYAAPEQRVRGGSIGPWTDIFAVGLMVNELFTGHIPAGANYKKISDSSSDYGYLDVIVDRMIAQDHTQRHKNINEIKSEIQYYGKIQTERQKLSALENKVIAATDADDPLIVNPPQIRDLDWNNNILTIEMTAHLNDKWRMAMLNMGNYESIPGLGPDTFRINGNKITNNVRDYQVDQAVDLFKRWLPRINEVYKTRIQSEKIREIQKATEDHQRKLVEQKKRLEIMAKLKQKI